MATGSTDILKQMGDSLMCALCTDTFIDPRVLPCQHSYCHTCLDEHIKATTRVYRIKCPLCNMDVTVSERGVEAFPRDFKLAEQVAIYQIMLQMNTGSSGSVRFREHKGGRCKLHKSPMSQLCENCNSLICEKCASVTHKNHRTVPVSVVVHDHKDVLSSTRQNMADHRSHRDSHLQELRQALSEATHKKDEGLRQVEQQEDDIILHVKKHSQTIQDDIIAGFELTKQQIDDQIKNMQSDQEQLGECMQHIDTCLDGGSDVDIVETSVKEGANFEGIVQELSKIESIPSFSLNLVCPPVSNLSRDVVALVECGVKKTTSRTPAQSTAMEPASASHATIIKEPSRSRLTFTPTKVGQFDIGADPGGIACTPAGLIVVCNKGSNHIQTYTVEGQKIQTFRAPAGTRAYGLDCTTSHIYVTDPPSKSVHVLDYAANLVASIKTNIQGLYGVSVNDNKVYLTSLNIPYGSDLTDGVNGVYEIDIVPGTKYSAPRLFAAGINFFGPRDVCMRQNSIAVSSNGSHCVHVFNQDGSTRFTHGKPGQAGDGPELLNSPNGVVFDAAGRLFISEWKNNRVSVLSPEGHYLGSINLKEEGLHPKRVTITPHGQLVVACFSPHRVLIYNI